MSNRLGGKQGTAYLGTNANQPPNWVFSDRDPNQYDVNNVSLGDLWLNQVDESAWILVSLAGDVGSKGSLATWVSLANDAHGALSTLTANTGGVIAGDNNGNINVVGDGVGITITGDPVTHTLTASLVGGGIGAQTFDADFGSAIPAAGVVNVIANNAGLNSGSSVSITGAGNTLTLNVTDLADNTIIGKSSGNLAMTGGDNTILGEASGVSLASGSDNTIIGGTSGNALTSGSNNILLGSGSGSALTTTDSDNTVIGSAGFVGANQFVGVTAGANGTPVIHNYPGVNASTTNGGNLFLGMSAGNFTLAGGAGNASNNGIGQNALSGLTTGFSNEALGVSALSKVTSGSVNIGIGHNAGFNSGGNTGLVSGTNNVLIGNTAGSAYTAAESNNIILGTVTGTAAESNALRIGSGTGSGTGQINKAFVSGIRGITPTINDGIPVFVNSVGQFGTVGTGGATLVSTLTGNSGGAVGPASGNINIVGDGVTATVVGNPGTNTLTISAVGGGGGDLNFLDGDVGTATPSVGTINVITDNVSQAAGASVLFTGSSNNLTLSVSDADDNTLVGNASGNATLTGTKNTGFGVLTGTAITTGLNNSMVGYGAGTAFTTGSYNSFLGYLAGSAYTTSESSNISINAVGTAAESNVLRIGAGTGTGNAQINKAFISGIRGKTPDTADGIPLFIGSAGQLGTVGNGGTTMIQTVTGNSGGAVGPASGNINIVGDGTTATVVGNPGTNTLTISALGGGGGDLTVLAADTGSATPVAGTINIIANNSTLGCGTSVLFTGSSNNIVLEVSDANDNTLIGDTSGNGASTTGSKNTALGVLTGSDLTTGLNNSMVGYGAGNAFTTGSYNSFFGYLAGSSYTGSESSNICINSTGTAAESNILRIGSGTGTGNAQINKAFISGIRGKTPDINDGIPMFVNSVGQIGTVGTGGATLVSSLTGNSGGAVGPASGNINIVGDGTTATVVGNPGTNTLTITAIGGGSGLATLAGDIGSASPSAGTINLITDNSVQGAGSSVVFVGSSNNMLLQVSDASDNTLMGTAAGNGTLSGSKNTGFGVLTGTSLTTGINNSMVGYGSGNALTNGSYNTFLGYLSGSSYISGSSSNISINSTGILGESNTLRIGAGTGTGNAQVNRTFIAGIRGITTGISNAIPVVIDSNGQLGTGGGASTITTLTGNSGGAVSATGGNVDVRGDGTYITIAGNPGTSTLTASATGLLVKTVTGNSGGAVPASGGNLTIRGDGTSVNVVGNPGTNTLTISAAGGAGGPAFFAYLVSTVSNATGGGVPYQIIYDTLPYNSGGAFNLGTSVFTAPVTGLYNFSCGVGLSFGSGVTRYMELSLVTTSRTFSLLFESTRNSNFQLDRTGELTVPGGNVYTNMTAGDTARIVITVNLGSQNVDVTGIAPAVRTFFSGELA